MTPTDESLNELDPNAHNGIAKVAEALSAVLLVTLGLMLLGSTMMRHVGMGDPRLFELTRVAFVYLVGFSAIAAYLRVQNIVVPGIWRMNSATHQAACTFICGVLTWLTGQYIYSTGWETDTMSLLQLPENTPYVPVFLFALAITLLSAARMVRAFRSDGPSRV
ncbi:TRAP transporter small permease subunit [Mesorhizobium sp. 1B3]|uniref:TRAP transporter small permease subunit n=1 Tax=Mesorhizobium sp. 1B3 TaxID=3243599 RepID=UPI003D96AB29